MMIDGLPCKNDIIFVYQRSFVVVENIVEKLQLARKTVYFCAALESNNFQPCTNFVTSYSKASLEDIHAQNDKKRTDEIENCWISLAVTLLMTLT